MVGLPDASVRESRDRVRSAIRNSGFEFPQHRITVNLAPADVRKAGAAFDLPIALGILMAQGVVERREIADVLVLGELSLDGSIHPARGVLPIAAAARRDGLAVCILPRSNAGEAAMGRIGRVGRVIACRGGERTESSGVERLRRRSACTDGHEHHSGSRRRHGQRWLDVRSRSHAPAVKSSARRSTWAGKTMMARRDTGDSPAVDVRRSARGHGGHSVAWSVVERMRPW